MMRNRASTIHDATATARPIPLSPPVINATFRLNFPQPITGTRSQLRPHFVLATRLFSLVLGRANFLLLRHTIQIFAARECLSHASLQSAGRQ
jgi:hypothetical protein